MGTSILVSLEFMDSRLCGNRMVRVAVDQDGTRWRISPAYFPGTETHDRKTFYFCFTKKKQMNSTDFNASHLRLDYKHGILYSNARFLCILNEAQVFNLFNCLLLKETVFYDTVILD